MTTKLFKTKEQYLQFRQAFAKAAQAGTLRAEHFIFLNLVRGLPYHRGFTPVTSTNKLSNGADICGGLDRGVKSLRYAVHSSRDARGGDLKRFLAPFEEAGDDLVAAAITQLLQELDNIKDNVLDKHETYYSYFGVGRKIAQKMLAGDLKPKNYQEFIEIKLEIENAQ